MTELSRGVSMSIRISKSDRERAFERIANEQFDAFEQQERVIRAQQREARAEQLRLPMQLATRLREERLPLKRRG